MELANPNPTVHSEGFVPRKQMTDTDDNVRDPIDAMEVLLLIKSESYKLWWPGFRPDP